MRCHRCGKEVKVTTGIGRRDHCPHCGSDLRCCCNCAFYDISYANACRETQADRVSDKERSNFCDFFRAGTRSAAAPKRDQAVTAKDKLEALFKK